MKHIKLSGIPEELHQAAIEWLNRHLDPSKHTAEVVSDTGARIFGTADPAEEPQRMSPPAAQV